MSKAELFDKFLADNKIDCFSKEEIDNDQHSVVYRAHMEVCGQMLPTMVVFDSSIYGMVQVLIAPKAVNDGNRLAVLELLNELNRKYKVFKYYIGENGELSLDSCIADSDASFEPLIVHTVINVILKHLNEEYPQLMKAIWVQPEASES